MAEKPVVSLPVETPSVNNNSDRMQHDSHGPSSAAPGGNRNDEDLFASVSGSQRKPVDKNSLNTMELLSGQKVDLDLIEELIAGCSSAASGKLEGLQQFSVESTTKVVHIRATTTRKLMEGNGSTAAVIAAGVGWGLESGTPSSSINLDSRGNAAEAELVKKRQIRNVRKAFGLQPTPLHDSSAQLLEVGAGAWQ